jgi:hypothetical protein
MGTWRWIAKSILADATNRLYRSRSCHPVRVHDVGNPERRTCVLERDRFINRLTDAAPRDPFRLATTDEPSVQGLAASSTQLDYQVEPDPRRDTR